ncbi:murein hydrolase activator EnvC family protein [Thermodesulfovibrio hydrogeniphilus]
MISISFASQSKEELKNIKKEIETHKKKLRETEQVEKNVIQELNKFNKELAEIESKIKEQKAKIKSIQANILKIEEDIRVYSEKLETRKNYLSARIKSAQRLHNQPDPLLMVLMENELTKAIRLVRNIQRIVNIDKTIMEEYKNELNQLITYDNQLKRLQASLKQEEITLEKTYQQQNIKKKEREVLLAKVRQEKSMYEKKIKELEENARRLTRLLQETEKKEKRTGKTDDLPDTGFTKRKGTLLWPVSGPVIAHYGKQTDPVFNVPMFRSGIYIKAPPRAGVKSAAEGKVVYANYFKGYENLVIISHGDGYYTVYGNLGSFSVKEGSFVKAGQIIGTVSEKSAIDTPAVYFEVRYRGKPLNPEEWLRK